MNESPVIQPRFKAEITIVPRIGDTWMHDICGITAQHIVDQYEKVKAVEAESGSEVYLPNDVFIAADKEPKA